jgi:hypothetical protein
MTQRAYLYQCPTTRNTAAIVAHSEHHARKWFTTHCGRSTWRYVGVDERREEPSYTPVAAVLNEDGQQVQLWQGVTA